LIGNTDKLDISKMLTRSADFKMAASMREKSYCVLEHAKTSSVTDVQSHFWNEFARKAPHRLNIKRVKQFDKTGCLCKGKSMGWPSINNEVVENIRATMYEAQGSLPIVPAENLNVSQAFAVQASKAIFHNIGSAVLDRMMCH
jgi:hypothetical protein